MLLVELCEGWTSWQAYIILSLCYSVVVSFLMISSQMFWQGNTAVYLLYAHACICSIIRKSGKVVEDLKETGTIVLAHPAEHALGLHLLQFAEIVEEACSNLLPNVLCEYLYNLSKNFTTFYTNSQITITSDNCDQ